MHAKVNKAKSKDLFCILLFLIHSELLTDIPIILIFTMGVHFDLQTILEYHRDGRLPEDMNKDQRANFRNSADKFRFKKGKLLKRSKRLHPVPGGEYVRVVVSRAEQLEVTRKEHR